MSQSQQLCMLKRKKEEKRGAGSWVCLYIGDREVRLNTMGEAIWNARAIKATLRAQALSGQRD